MMSTILQEFEDGKRYMVAEMPTGTGKTFIAMAVKQLLDVPTIYVCTTKSLQEQFLKDFPNAKLIKGRNNYPCGRIPQKFPEVTAEDCVGSSCLVDCPYKSAKETARKAQLVVANMSYFMNEVQYGKQFAKRGFVVVDEADTLEDALLDQVSVQITQFDVEKMKLGRPVLKTKFEEWKIWASEALKNVRLQEQALEAELKQYDTEDSWASAPIALVRERKFVSRLAGKLGFFLKYVDQYWVWEETKAYTRSRQEYWKWIFKPVRVDQFGDIIFQNGEKFLLMSATILDNTQYERNVGLAKYREDLLVGNIEVNSSFPKERRPVIVRKGVDLRKANYEAGIIALPRAVKEILEAHPNDKGVIHAVTYKTAQALKTAFPQRVLVHDSRNRNEIIQRFKDSSSPLVLVSPSVERGEDFPDDICRFIVIVKLPFPYLGDPRVERRLYSMKDGQRWYALRTISKLIQMTGRGMRHEDDYCTSYILDPAFKRVFLEHRSMFPQWWRESLIWEEKGGRTVDGQGKRGNVVQGDPGWDSPKEAGKAGQEGPSEPEEQEGGTEASNGAPGAVFSRSAIDRQGTGSSSVRHGLQPTGVLRDNGGSGDRGAAGADPVSLGSSGGDREAPAEAGGDLSAQERFHGKTGWPKGST